MKKVLLWGFMAAGLVWTGPSAEAGPRGRGRALDDLVETETQFAARASVVGWRKAFLEYFAEDGVNFTPAPVRAHERLPKLPPEVDDSHAEWYPVMSDASRAGDLGFNWGPYTWRFPKNPEKAADHGYFFTIWKRQPKGDFKVALDLGVSAPAAGTFKRPWRETEASRYKQRGALDRVATLDGLKAADTALCAAIQKDGMAGGYTPSLEPDAVFLRSGRRPLEAPATIREYLDKGTRGEKVCFEPQYAEVAESGDLGYTYGAYKAAAGDESRSGGYYVHVWRRSAKGAWKLAMDVIN